MNEIWTIIEPYILTVLGALGGGSVIAVLVNIVCKRLIAKAGAVYDVNNIATKVADKLGGKTIDIDITSVVEKRLAEIVKTLTEQVDVVAGETKSYKRLLALIGEALTHLKMLTDDERAQLIAAVKELDSEFVAPEREVISTIKLEPITDLLVEEESTVNLG